MAAADAAETGPHKEAAGLHRHRLPVELGAMYVHPACRRLGIRERKAPPVAGGALLEGDLMGGDLLESV